MTESRPGAQEWVPEHLSLTALREAAQACRGCELYRDATQAVMGSGRSGADLMVLGEQPGDKEDLAGEPFVGPAGKLLDRALEDAGIEPDRVFRTNVVKHFRFSGTRGKQRIHKSPSTVHVAACGPWLVAELSLVRPTGVVVLGGTAGKALYGSGFRVGESRGRLQEWPVGFGRPGGDRRGEEGGEEVGADEVGGVAPDWVLTTTHPSAVLRSRQREQDYEMFVTDLEVAARALAG